MRPLGEKAQQLPSSWLGGTTAQIGVGSVLRSRTAIGRYLAGFGRLLPRSRASASSQGSTRKSLKRRG